MVHASLNIFNNLAEPLRYGTYTTLPEGTYKDVKGCHYVAPLNTVPVNWLP